MKIFSKQGTLIIRITLLKTGISFFFLPQGITILVDRIKTSLLLYSSLGQESKMSLGGLMMSVRLCSFLEALENLAHFVGRIQYPVLVRLRYSLHADCQQVIPSL